MLETAVRYGAEKLWFEKEVPEACRVDTDIAAFLIRVAARHGEVAFLRRSVGRSCWRRGGGIVCLYFVVRIVDKILLVRHGETPKDSLSSGLLLY